VSDLSFAQHILNNGNPTENERMSLTRSIKTNKLRIWLVRHIPKASLTPLLLMGSVFVIESQASKRSQ
jgi:hypothetical protein